ncbi:MAG: glycine cleavage system protein GcvH [Myxococcales bacterium]|nr:glycine cleavage system protein GcvH [Myxococcales bacterium]
MSKQAERRYTEDHEWACLEDDGQVRIGITDHAQESLGDVVYVELPAVGDAVKLGEKFGVVESVKTVSDLYAPCDGVVTQVNENLENTPELVNAEPYGKGWIIRVKPSNLGQLAKLLDEEAYQALLG